MLSVINFFYLFKIKLVFKIIGVLSRYMKKVCIVEKLYINVLVDKVIFNILLKLYF